MKNKTKIGTIALVSLFILSLGVVYAESEETDEPQEYDIEVSCGILGCYPTHLNPAFGEISGALTNHEAEIYYFKSRENEYLKQSGGGTSWTNIENLLYGSFMESLYNRFVPIEQYKALEERVYRAEALIDFLIEGKEYTEQDLQFQIALRKAINRGDSVFDFEDMRCLVRTQRCVRFS
jgi:hypothetical protein